MLTPIALHCSCQVSSGRGRGRVVLELYARCSLGFRADSCQGWYHDQDGRIQDNTRQALVTVDIGDCVVNRTAGRPSPLQSLIGKVPIGAILASLL